MAGKDAGGRRSPPVAGIYIHVPFCVRRCRYCDFYTTTDLSLRPPYVNHLLREIAHARRLPAPAGTLYFGGGTPSLLLFEQIKTITEAVREHHGLADASEITLEANPATLSDQHLQQMRSYGINRLSIGVQSFADANLRFLGRLHTADQARQSIAQARKAGFDNLSLDLIYGLPGQTADQWEKDLDQALAYEVEHLSCYLLTFESGTQLAQCRDRKEFLPLAGHHLADLFDRTHQRLAKAGYDHYEISNFARNPAFRSRHNAKYWQGNAYLGFGPAAHSFISPRRWWNAKDLAGWMHHIARSRLPAADSETLSVGEQQLEAIYLGLRTVEGIDLKDFQRRFGVDLMQLCRHRISRLEAEKWLYCTSERCRLTPIGMRYHEAICGDLAEALQM